MPRLIMHEEQKLLLLSLDACKTQKKTCIFFLSVGMFDVTSRFVLSSSVESKQWEHPVKKSMS